jgi:hypothetical protein
VVVGKDVENVSNSSEVGGSKLWTLGARSPKADWKDSSCGRDVETALRLPVELKPGQQLRPISN